MFLSDFICGFLLSHKLRISFKFALINKKYKITTRITTLMDSMHLFKGLLNVFNHYFEFLLFREILKSVFSKTNSFLESKKIIKL